RSRAEGAVELPAGGLVEAARELLVALEEALPGPGEAHAAVGPAPRHPLHELEAGRRLQVAQVAPRVAIGHLQLLRRLLERAARVDQLEQAGAPVPELQVLAERHPHPELGLHLNRILLKRSTTEQRYPPIERARTATGPTATAHRPRKRGLT